MQHDRREFLGKLAAGTMFGALPFSDLLGEPLAPGARPDGAAPWDLSWVDRVKGKYRAVFDVPEVDSAYGVWRASFFPAQYAEVLGAKPAEISTVLVLRHNGFALALQQPFWDKHNLAKVETTVHPLTMQPTDRNPALLASSRNEVPAQFDAMALDQFISRGGIVLACNVALDFLANGIAQREGATADAVRQAALQAMVPGVTLQPSGVFAVLRAQDVGCKYIRAS
jgi:hypothetical protein